MWMEGKGLSLLIKGYSGCYGSERCDPKKICDQKKICEDAGM